jgi:hypothetical protein
MQEGINPVTDLARENHIEEIKAITEQIKRCESKHYYTQALPLRKRLKLLKNQLKVYDKEMGYQR